MSKDHELDDAELADLSGAGDELQDADIKKPDPGPIPIGGDGTHLDDPTGQPDIGGGLTDPNLR